MKLNKKVSLFGKEVSVFALILIGMVALGSAALVPYLSNIITGNATVDYPFELLMGVNNDAMGKGPLTIAGLYGSDSFTLNTQLTNKADKHLDAENVKITIANNLATGSQYKQVDCDEFTITITGTDTKLTCQENGDIATVTTSAISLDAGASQVIPFTVTTAVNIAPASYTFSISVPYP